MCSDMVKRLINMQLEDDLIQAVDKVSDKERMTRTAYVRQALLHFGAVRREMGLDESLVGDGDERVPSESGLGVCTAAICSSGGHRN